MTATCPHCHAAIPEDSRFCAFCGRDVRPETVCEPPPVMSDSIPVCPLPQPRYAAFLPRLLAWVVDVSLSLFAGLVAVFIPLYLLVAQTVIDRTGQDLGRVWQDMEPKHKTMIMLLYLTWVTLVPWLYYALQEASARQATLGKRLFGLVVTDKAGRRISFARATGRFFGRFLLGLPGYAFALITRRRQALHDLMSGCVVMERMDR